MSAGRQRADSRDELERSIAALSEQFAAGAPAGAPPAGARERILTRAGAERPECEPTLSLRVRGRRFDIYCEHASDVTLDGHGIPVVGGHTVSCEDLASGWYAAGSGAVD